MTRYFQSDDIPTCDNTKDCFYTHYKIIVDDNIIKIDRYAIKQTKNISNRTKEIFEDEANKAITSKTHFSFQTNYDKAYTDKWRVAFSNAGFKTELYFLYVDSIAKCKQRVAKRVKEGGHNVSEEQIIKRYKKGLENLNIYFDKFDKIVIIDTSKELNILLLEINDQRINYINENLVTILFNNKLFKILDWLKNSI